MNFAIKNFLPWKKAPLQKGYLFIHIPFQPNTTSPITVKYNVNLVAKSALL